jgi:hypothetical protein
VLTILDAALQLCRCGVSDEDTLLFLMQQLCSFAALQLCSFAALQLCSFSPMMLSHGRVSYVCNIILIYNNPALFTSQHIHQYQLFYGDFHT